MPRFVIAPLGLTTEGSTKLNQKVENATLKKLQCDGVSSALVYCSVANITIITTVTRIVEGCQSRSDRKRLFVSSKYPKSNAADVKRPT